MDKKELNLECNVHFYVSTYLNSTTHIIFQTSLWSHLHFSQREQMNSEDGSSCLRIPSWAHRTNLSSPHFLHNEMKIKDDRGCKTNSWLYFNTEPNQFPHILGLKWKHSDKRFIIKRIIIRKGALQIRCELGLTASIRFCKMTVWDLPLVESNFFVTKTLLKARYSMLIRFPKIKENATEQC